LNLIYDDLNHQYSLELGGETPPVPLMSVTQILRAADMYGYPKTSVNVEKMNYGTHVHKITEMYDMKTIDVPDLLDDDRFYLTAYKRFQEDFGFVPSLSETKFFHPVYFYAGTIDRYGAMRDNGYVIIDIKTGRPHPCSILQLAAYREMLIVNGHPVRKAYAVYLDSSGEYKAVEAPPGPEPFETFLSALRIVRWKKENNIGRSNY